jgi:hypothetical protein
MCVYVFYINSLPFVNDSLQDALRNALPWFEKGQKPIRIYRLTPISPEYTESVLVLTLC